MPWSVGTGSGKSSPGPSAWHHWTCSPLAWMGQVLATQPRAHQQLECHAASVVRKERGGCDLCPRGCTTPGSSSARLTAHHSLLSISLCQLSPSPRRPSRPLGSCLSSFFPSDLRQRTPLPGHFGPAFPEDMAESSGEQPGLAAWSLAASPTHAGPSSALLPSSPALPAGLVSSTPSIDLCPFPARCSWTPSLCPKNLTQKFSVVQPLSALSSQVSHP